MNSIGKKSSLRASLLMIVMLVAVLLGHTSVSAAAETFTVRQTIPIDFEVFIPCANGGEGEFVQLTGNLNDVFHVTLDGQGGFHISGHSNPQGVIGLGLTTGDKYQGTGVGRFNFNGRLGSEFTAVDNFKIIGPGPGNNFLVHDNLHVTVNANGTLTAEHDNFSVECK